MALFDHVGELVHTMAPTGLGDVHMRSHRRGLKVWFGPTTPIKEHYEAQMIPRRHVDGADGAALEIGFHAEHKAVAANEAVLDALVAERRSWKRELGDETEFGCFLGNDTWRRISDVWLDPAMDDPDLAFEIASRLVDYLLVIEPIRQARTADRHDPAEAG